MLNENELGHISHICYRICLREKKYISFGNKRFSEGLLLA